MVRCCLWDAEINQHVKESPSRDPRVATLAAPLALAHLVDKEPLQSYRQSDLQAAADKLLAAAETGERDAVAAAVRDTGGACKACHDEYKAKDYLY
jgi:cytochrome c556